MGAGRGGYGGVRTAYGSWNAPETVERRRAHHAPRGANAPLGFGPLGPLGVAVVWCCEPERGKAVCNE